MIATGSTASFTDHPGAAPQRFYRVVLLSTVTPLTPLVVVANNAARLYGATNPVFSGTITGVQSGDNITATYSTTAAAASPVGSYPITPTLVDPDGKLENYLVSITNGTVTVMAAPLTVTANDTSRVYGAANPVFNGSITGIQNGDNITATYATTATISSPVGTYPIVPTLVDPDQKLTNYALTVSNGTLTVTAVPTPTILSLKPVGGDSVVITWTSLSNRVYRVQYKASLSSGSWLNLAPNVTANGATASFTDQPGAAPQRFYRVVLLSTVTPLTPLVVVANNASRLYGATNPLFSGTISGVKTGDDITATYSTSAQAASPVGSYAITPTLVDPNGRLENYLVSITNGTLTVTPAPLAVTVDHASRPYGAANPAFSGTITGIQNGDNITATYATTATISSPVGTYPILPSLVDPGSRLSNYTVTLNNGTLTVTAPGTPSILGIHRTSDKTVTVTVSGIPGAEYVVQASSALGALAAWTNLSTNIAGADGRWTFADAAADQPTRFYRAMAP